MNLKNLMSKKGNDSLTLGAMWGLGSALHPCPICLVSTGAFLINGIREKLKD